MNAIMKLIGRHGLKLGAVLLLLGMPYAAVADVVAVVSAKSSVASLSKSQISDIFLGKTAVFPTGESVVPVDQVEGSTERDEFYARYAGKSAPQVKAHWAKIIFTGRGRPPMEAHDSSAVKRIIAANPNAIGYIDRAMVDGSVRVFVPE